MTDYPNAYTNAANDYATSYAPAGGYRPWSYSPAVEAAARYIGREDALRVWSYDEMSKACNQLARIQASAQIVRKAIEQELDGLK